MAKRWCFLSILIKQPLFSFLRLLIIPINKSHMQKNYLFRITFLLILLQGSFLFSQSQGPNSPSAAVSVSAPSGTPWGNPTNVFTSNSAPASCTMPGYPTCATSNCYYSQALAVTGFGFAIPAIAIIKGIVVEVQRRSINFPAHLSDSTVRLLRSGIPDGTSRADTAKWGLAYIYKAHGDSTDLWGTSWTPADINDPNFGVYFSAYVSTNTTGPPQVDHIRIKVYYDTTATTGIIFAGATNAVTLFPNPVTDFVKVEMNFVKSQTEETKVSILNVIGEELFSDKILVNKKTVKSFSVATLPAGIYFLSIKNSGDAFIKKFIKQ